MGFGKEDLDFVLVPAGFLIMFAYLLYFLIQYYTSGTNTFIDVEINDSKTLVQRILEAPSDERVKAGVSVISTNTVTAMALASVSLALCTLIGSWIGSSTSDFVPVEMIYGNTSALVISVKYFCVLISLLFAFSFFVQSARNFIHSSYLFSTPARPATPACPATPALPVTPDEAKVKKAVERGSIFWSLGLRSLYFALNFMLWFFGPIPMLACSIVIVICLARHDSKT